MQEDLIQQEMKFIDTVLSLGYSVKICPSLSTESRYLYIYDQNKKPVCKIRYSSHRPDFRREREKYCDFYVGASWGKPFTFNDVIKFIKNSKKVFD